MEIALSKCGITGSRGWMAWTGSLLSLLRRIDMTFGEQVITVLEMKARRWRYWDTIVEKNRYNPPDVVKKNTGFSLERIEFEWNLAWSDLFFG
jgi:hypothetical protein